MFNAEVCYGSGLIYNTEEATVQVHKEVDDFTAVPVLDENGDIILNEDGTRIVRLARKQACYVRFAPADAHGTIPYSQLAQHGVARRHRAHRVVESPIPIV